MRFSALRKDERHYHCSDCDVPHAEFKLSVGRQQTSALFFCAPCMLAVTVQSRESIDDFIKSVRKDWS